jgi:hypothetical protein
LRSLDVFYALSDMEWTRRVTKEFVIITLSILITTAILPGIWCETTFDLLFSAILLGIFTQVLSPALKHIAKVCVCFARLPLSSMWRRSCSPTSLCFYARYPCASHSRAPLACVYVCACASLRGLPMSLCLACKATPCMRMWQRMYWHR